MVDEWGEAIALYRMEDAPFGTAELARDKAWTAAAFKMPSSEVSKFGDPKKPHFGLPAANWNERLTTIQGGFPIESEGKVIGALGVSGGSPEDDVKVGKKSLKIFREVS